ncbi:MAG: hypothetical protein A2Z14_02340 [Chloroflexi bacterium RBG_16_48_8]|nr:MAG: hypothetical protein A2Z14_02340 [Chloroflexi bacterium RBG_16_48_8]
MMHLWMMPEGYQTISSECREAEKILANEVVVLPLLYARFHLFVKYWVRKLPIQPIRVFSLKDIIIEAHS